MTSEEVTPEQKAHNLMINASDRINTTQNSFKGYSYIYICSGHFIGAKSKGKKDRVSVLKELAFYLGRQIY